MNIRILLVALFVILFISCNKEEEKSNTEYDCEFVQIDSDMDGWIDDTERSIMNECQENQLNTKDEIETNLVGEWELIGHGEGWFPRISKPCAYLTVSEDSLMMQFENSYIDTISVHSWTLEEYDWQGETYYRFNTEPQYVPGLYISTFCESYMFGDATPADGNMYLYEKVK